MLPSEFPGGSSYYVLALQLNAPKGYMLAWPPTEGEEVETPASSVRMGYAIGIEGSITLWFYQNGEKIGEKKYTLKWEGWDADTITYSQGHWLYFDYGGGVNPDSPNMNWNSIFCNNGEVNGWPKDPVMPPDVTGYEFAGWYKVDDTGGEAQTTGDPVTKETIGTLTDSTTLMA